MVEDLHPTPDLREFDENAHVSVRGQAIRLQLMAIDYGTHLGSVLRFFADDSDEEIVSIPIEAHWHQRGRFVVQTGPVKAGADEELGDWLGELGSIAVLQAINKAMATARSRNDVFDSFQNVAQSVLAALVSEVGSAG